MAGTCNSVRCLPTSALSRAEVTGDFGGSLMRQSSKVVRHDVAIAGTIKLLHAPPVLPGQSSLIGAARSMSAIPDSDQIPQRSGMTRCATIGSRRAYI